MPAKQQQIGFLDFWASTYVSRAHYFDVLSWGFCLVTKLIPFFIFTRRKFHEIWYIFRKKMLRSVFSSLHCPPFSNVSIQFEFTIQIQPFLLVEFNARIHCIKRLAGYNSLKWKEKKKKKKKNELWMQNSIANVEWKIYTENSTWLSLNG